LFFCFPTILSQQERSAQQSSMLAEAAAAIVGNFSNHAVPTGVISLEPSATLFNGARAPVKAGSGAWKPLP